MVFPLPGGSCLTISFRGAPSLRTESPRAAALLSSSVPPFWLFVEPTGRPLLPMVPISATKFVPTRVPPMTEKPIVVLDENGELKEEVKTCIKMIADADIILATGHCDYDETYAITKYAIEVGVTKIVFTHLPMFTTMDKEALKKITDLGGIVEFTYMNQLEATPEAYRMTGAEMAEYIRFFGPDKCLCSTDFGISLVPTPVEGMRMVIRWLIEQGFTDDEITTMIRKNPAKLLGIQ